LSAMELNVQLAAINPMLQHRRLAHAGDARRRHAERNDVVDRSGPIEHCEACRLGKAKRQVSRDAMPRASKPGEIIHVDVQTIKPIGYNGYNYFALYLDDKTRNMWVRFLKKKGDASQASIEFVKQIKIVTGAYPREWNTDGGKEFLRFNAWIKKEGTETRISPPRTPEPNGPIERAQGYVMQTARVMVIDSGLPAYLWPLAVETAIYVINRLVRDGETQSPLKQWRDILGLPNADTSLRHVKVWGCKAYVHIPQEDRIKALKMMPRARVGRLVGYEGDHGHVYKVWIPSTGEIKRSRDVTFWEDDFYKPPSGAEAHESVPKKGPSVTMKGTKKASQLMIEGGQTEGEQTVDQDRLLEALEDTDLRTIFDFTDVEYVRGRVQTLSPDPIPATTNRDSLPSVHIQRPNPKPEPTTKRVSTRSTKGIPPKRLEDEIADAAANKARTRRGAAGSEEDPIQGVAAETTPKKYWEVRIPHNYRQAKASPQWEEWHQACLNQISKIKAMNAYELVTAPPDDVQILPGKWVFDIKPDAEGNILQYRARWVVCGNFQEKSNANRYAPVASDGGIKVFLTKVARDDKELRQIDIVSAYLHAVLQGRKVYMRQPTGFEEGSKGDVWLLLQALYGLRESANLWYKTFDTQLRGNGFEPLIEDPCIYLRRKDDTMLALYVDDCLLAANSHDINSALVAILKDSFGVKDLGEPTRFLGCNLVRDRANRTITLSQIPYVMKTLTRYAMQHCSGNKVPMHPGWKGESNDPDTADKDRTDDFMAITGSVNWLVTRTRPDLALANGKLQRQSNAPSEKDLRAAKGLLRYLKTQGEYGIILNADPAQGLTIYTDAAFQDNPDGRSTEGHVILFGGAPIIWSSKKQTFVAPSTTIAEFCAYDAAIKNAMWINKLLIACGLRVDAPIPVWTDSANGLIISGTCRMGPSTRWIDNRFFFVRDAYDRKVIELRHIDGKINPADGFTKALDEGNYRAFQERIGVRKLDTAVVEISAEHDDEDC
jgi:hypothetical protein